MIELYELAATDDKQVFSPYCWRIRLALHHKQLPFKSIPWRMTEKNRIAFADTERVPVLVDGEQTLSDSIYKNKSYSIGSATACRSLSCYWSFRL